MKKAICIITIVSMLGALTACAMRATAAGGEPKTGEIVLVTDKGVFSSSPSIRSVWKGMEAFSGEKGLTHLRVTALEPTDTARLKTIREVMSSEVKVVICQGPSYETVVFEAQSSFPDVMFLLLDGEPHGQDGAIYETKANTHCILYEESQAGFLAGYAAVMEGYRKLGFCGEQAAPPVVRYGYGFLQGVNQAAVALGLGNASIQVRYWYAGAEQNPERTLSILKDWYGKGIELISTYDHESIALSKTVIAAAEAAGGKVIPVGADRRDESGSVVCSVIKGYEGAVTQALSSLEANQWHWDADRAGCTAVLGVTDGMLSLQATQSPWYLENFTETAYADLLKQFQEDTILLDRSSSRELLPATPHCSVMDLGVG